MSLIVNGNEYDYGSMEVRFDDVPGVQSLQGVKTINYSSSLEGGEVRGSRSTTIGSTPGDASHAAEMMLYRRDWEAFLRGVGQAGSRAKLGLVRITITVEYSEENAPVMQDVIVKAKIKKVDSDNSEGVDAAMVRVTLDPVDVRFGDGEGNQASLYMNEFFQGQTE